VRTVAMDYIRTTPVVGRICSIHEPIWIGQPENAQSTSVRKKRKTPSVFLKLTALRFVPSLSWQFFHRLF
jgi:hypothetical protein